jgi:hypothetical protein
VHVAQVESMAARLKNDGVKATITNVVETVIGPQRVKLPATYALHTPGTGGREEFGALLTAGFPSRERMIDAVGWLLPEVLAQPGAVLEVERVVAVTETDGTWRSAPFDTIAPISADEVGFTPSDTLPMEVHYAIDVLAESPRGHRPPVALRTLFEDTMKHELDVGGWFLFQMPSNVWAYRSNMFTDMFVSLDELSRHREILADCARRYGFVHRVRIFVERVLGIWKGEAPRGEARA